MITALTALNHLENKGTILVTLPGCLSSIFGYVGETIVSGNTEIGVSPTDKTKGEIYKHFAEIIKEGGDLVLL